ncbi:Iron-dependent repressor IdeR [Corynebacterium urogenitale]|uniref:Diphtheria toxin repressor n=1 Tax=Corynebacterium urogenitale TaxID=2487892 RepID=A0A5J6Z7D7_9CORY|nr:metal-dependent transcriptional regulator [Corynebacterium urogenitale]QFQ02844.1 Iron-dependent repressor IdeR [Corynebacterium urogenitale]
MHVLDLPEKSQDYLKAIFDLHEWGEGRATLGRIAERLGQRTSTTSEAIKRLVKQGLVEHAPYADVQLTDEGQSLALQMVRRHRLIETYLFRELGYALDELHEEAEVLEHAVSDTFLERIDAVMGRPLRDPHGDPIPSPAGVVNVPDVLSLSDATIASTYLIDRVSDRDPELLSYLCDRGVLPGAKVVVCERPYPELAELEIIAAPEASAVGSRVQLPAQSLGAVLVEVASSGSADEYVAGERGADEPEAVERGADECTTDSTVDRTSDKVEG